MIVAGSTGILIEWWDYHLKQVNRENFKANKNLSKLNPILGANNQPIILIYAIIKYFTYQSVKSNGQLFCNQLEYEQEYDPLSIVQKIFPP